MISYEICLSLSGLLSIISKSIHVAANGIISFFFNGWVVSHWEMQWKPTPALLPGKSYGRRSLVGYIPWGWEELDMTELLHFHFSLSCTGEGNGNPLQCSCLENPRDGGAWWAAVYGVTQSRTRLTWLSSGNIPLYVCATSSLSIYLLMDT